MVKDFTFPILVSSPIEFPLGFNHRKVEFIWELTCQEQPTILTKRHLL